LRANIKKPPSATQREEIPREGTEVVIMAEIAGGRGGEVVVPIPKSGK
jgi:hypothetical protein